MYSIVLDTSNIYDVCSLKEMLLSRPIKDNITGKIASYEIGHKFFKRPAGCTLFLDKDLNIKICEATIHIGKTTKFHITSDTEIKLVCVEQILSDWSLKYTITKES